MYIIMDPNVVKQLEEDEMIPPMEQNVKVANNEPLVKTERKLSRKRCSRGKHRNPKTSRCNKKCKDGYTRTMKSRKCVKKCSVGYKRTKTSRRCVKKTK